MPEELRDLFSQRSIQVEAKLADLVRRWMDEHDGTEPSVDNLWQLTRRAAVTSRPGKSSEPIDLRDDWLGRAAAAGFAVDHLVHGRLRPRLADTVDRDTIIATALERVTEQGSSWIEADLAREVSALAPPGSVGDAGALLALVDDLAAGSDWSLRGVAPTGRGRRPRATGWSPDHRTRHQPCAHDRCGAHAGGTPARLGRHRHRSGSGRRSC